jgi:flagellar hook-associated protein 3 FlgL
MRISTNMLQQRILSNLQQNFSSFAAAQNQVSTGKRFERLSEDPLAGVQVMTADRGLRGIDQYRRNSSAARTRTDAEEATLSQVTDLLTRAKELTLQEGSANGNADTRAAAKAEVDRIIEQVVQLGNTQVGNEYIFAGDMVNTSPFDASGAYLGDDGVRKAEVGQGYLITTNHTGRELLVNSGVLTTLQSLSTQLGSGTPATIGILASNIDNAFTNVQTLMSTNGARVRQIESAMQNSDALETNLSLRRSDLSEVNIEQATTQFVGLQNTLQAALLSASRVLNTSLTDYLR